jgi:hypothetical protein
MSRRKHKRIRIERKNKDDSFLFDWIFEDPIDDLAAGLLGVAFFFARRAVPNFDAYFHEQVRRQRDPIAWRKTLGLEDPVTRRQVQDRFRELARRHHPDRGGDHRKFVELVAARDAALAELTA